MTTPPANDKRTYATPELVVYGDLATLTLGSGGTKQDTGGSKAVTRP